MDVQLPVIYEDDEIIVFKAPTDEELVDLVYDVVRRRGVVTFRELREIFSGTAGEDRLRKALHTLLERGLIVELPGGRYGLPNRETVKEELRERTRRRLLRELGPPWKLQSP